jgi:hypothetical protein
VHPDHAGNTCIAGDPAFAYGQAALAALGLAALLISGRAFGGTRDRVGRGVGLVSLAAAAALMVAWVIVLLTLSPSTDLGNYGGCGLG